MTRNNIMLKRLGAAAFSVLLVWSMPGTSAFAEGVAEVAVQAQAQASQQADAAENADESSFTADERTGAEGAEASADEARSDVAPSADEGLAAMLSADGQNAAAVNVDDRDRGRYARWPGPQHRAQRQGAGEERDRYSAESGRDGPGNHGRL